MSDFVNSGWSVFVAALTIVGLLGCLWLLFIASPEQMTPTNPTMVTLWAIQYAKLHLVCDRGGWGRSRAGRQGLEIRCLDPRRAVHREDPDTLRVDGDCGLAAQHQVPAGIAAAGGDSAAGRREHPRVDDVAETPQRDNIVWPLSSTRESSSGGIVAS